MAKCLKCNRQSDTVGVQCSCGSYMVRDDCVEDSLHLLGQLIANKFVPISVITDMPCSVTYDVYQPSVDRKLAMYVVKPTVMKHPELVKRFRQVAELYASIQQQNILTVFGIQEIPQLETVSVILEPRRGEPFPALYRSGSKIDPVMLMHIFHQILQGFSACHMKSLTFPGFSMQNVWIARSGGDSSSVKLFGIFDANLHQAPLSHTMLDDVYQIGMLALSCLTGKPMPVSQVELPEEWAFLQPIAQIFMRAIAPPEQRYQSCVELLYAFEAVFELNMRVPDNRPVLLPDASQVRIEETHAPVTLEQIVWMHRPPQREN